MIRFKNMVKETAKKKIIRNFFATAVPLINEFVEGSFESITVTWNPRMRSRLGVAKYGPRTIELNARLLEDNPSELLDTFIHELAHIVTNDVYGNGTRFNKIKGHGREWRQVMRMFGAKPEQYHHLNVDHLKHKRKKFVATCGCSDRHHTVGIIRKNKIDKGARYVCKICKDVIEVVGPLTEGDV